MKNLANFDAFKLTKGQMNAVAGGRYCVLTLVDENGNSTSRRVEVPSNVSFDSAAEQLHKQYDICYDNVIVSHCN